MDDKAVGKEVTEEERKSAKQLGNLLKTTHLLDGSGADDSHDFLKNLPLLVKKRLRALKKLQVKGIDLEADFYKEVHKLECQFAARFQDLHSKRRDIVTGAYEPNEAESDYPLLNGLTDEEHAQLMTSDASTEQADKGVPNFWLTVFKNVELIAEMIQEQDEAILGHLTDIEAALITEPPGFKLIFHFSPNEYFSNATLTKEYSLKCDPDKESPFDYDGPEIVACKGCKIDWKEGKNVTVKLIKKKQKHKSTGGMRYVTKQVRADSFFNFFDPPENTPGNEDALDEDTRLLLHADFEIGQSLRDRIIPRAVLFFTGEAQEDDAFDDEEEGEDDEDQDDEEGNESDEGD